MKLLATADLHGNLDLYEWLVSCARNARPDAVILAGDLLATPADHPGPIEAAHRANAEAVATRLARVDAPVLYIMGNDDMVELDPGVDGIESVHGRRVELGKLNIVGYQFSLPFMGGIHEKPEEEIRIDLDRLAPLVDEQTVLVTHSPAFGILDLGLMDHHAGSQAILDLVSSRRPAAHIHGHIHSKFGRSGNHFNVAAAAQRRAVLIDFATMAHEVLD